MLSLLYMSMSNVYARLLKQQRAAIGNFVFKKILLISETYSFTRKNDI